MGLSVRTEERAGEVVLHLNGRIILGHSAESLRTAIKEQISHGHSDIVLDLRDVTYVDSAGLGVMASALVSASRENGHVYLQNATKRVRELLETTRLYWVFELSQTSSAAQQAAS